MRSSNNPINDESHIPWLKKSLAYPLYVLLLIILIHFYYNPSFYYFPLTNNIIISPTSQEVLRKNTICNYSDGEWVPTKMEPLYNDTTCSDTIIPGQNCVVFGRPDRGYLYWKWSPKKCKLPRFDPATFLKLVENKNVAFVGDSLARNQLESLICMLSSASKPHLYDSGGEYHKFRKWRFPSHNITVSNYWSPFLVKGTERTEVIDHNTMFLDTVNEVWASDLEHMDMLVLSTGQWYLQPAVYYAENAVLGCHYHCVNQTEIGHLVAYGRALKTTFESIIKRKGGQKGKGMAVFLTTFSPGHFVGEWDKLGSCRETQPYRESEKVLEGMEEEMRRIGVEKVREAKEYGNEVGVRLEALDITKLAFMRPDGHPGPYMRPDPFLHGVPEHVQNDCVHWCLPGPIDTWNDIFLDLIHTWSY